MNLIRPGGSKNRTSITDIRKTEKPRTADPNVMAASQPFPLDHPSIPL